MRKTGAVEILGAFQPPMRTRHLARIARRGVTFLVLPLLLASCSVLFVSPYDEMTDRAATQLVIKTETFLARYLTTVDSNTGKLMTRGRAYDDEAAKFYNEARGEAAAISLRAEQKDKNQEEIKILSDLRIQYGKLEASHRLGNITNSSAEGLRLSLRALLHVQLTKKRLGSSKKAATESGSNP